MEKICKRCGKIFKKNHKYSKKQWERAKFCSYKCNDNFNIWRQKGGLPWNKGLHKQLNNALEIWRKNGGVNWNKDKKGYKLSEAHKQKIRGHIP